ncbi:substrate-binding domain-containing protein [Salana multivorans]
MIAMSRRRTVTLAVGGALVLSGVLAGCTGGDQEEVTIGLVTKQEENPYWVEMREIAQETADERGATLVTATGSSDVDVAGQVEAVRSMIDDGVDGLLIAPTDSTELNEVLTQARDAGVIVIALDTPVDPIDTVDGFFATDNVEAGRLIGEYAAAKAEDLGLDPQVAMLNLAPGIASGEDRHAGFLEGFGLSEGSPEIVAEADTEGDRELGESAMAEILASAPDVNVVYTVNEPAALGALDALEAANRNLDEVVLVSINGGCVAMKGPVRGGQINATVQQFPQNMAREGVNAIVDAVRDGTAVPAHLDTGIQLITDDPAEGVDSRDTAYGVRNCWGG